MVHDKIGTCRQCKKTAPLSQRGLCEACGISNVTTNAESLKQKKGQPYKRWLAGMKRAIKQKG